MQLRQPLFGHDFFYNLVAQPAGQKKVQRRANGHPDDEVKTPPKNAVNIAAGNLHNFTGDGGHHNLEDLKTYENEDARKPPGFDVPLQFLPAGKEFRHPGAKNCGQVYYQPDKTYQGGNAQSHAQLMLAADPYRLLWRSKHFNYYTTSP